MKYNYSLKTLKRYIKKEGFKGYDPYDTLNSPFLFQKMGNWVTTVAIQIQKRNPLHIRPFLGIRKSYNPKGMGLMLKAYCIQYELHGKNEDLESIKFIFGWLKENTSKGYSGACWGYNFDWANLGGYLKAYTPSVVVTAFVIDGIFEYYKLTNDKEAKDLIVSSADYILKDLPITEFENGLSIAYTHQSTGVCYNASLLGAETLAKVYSITKDESLLETASCAVDYVLSKQKKDGSWFYSYNPELDQERRQIDFHQGFILVSLANYVHYSGQKRSDIEQSISKGLAFYKKEQFSSNGIAKWRIPKQWPIEIHNQAQGIITFALLQNYDASYLDFSTQIAEWTVGHMQDKKGYFYYQFHKNYKIKIPYMRWSQAWMLLALSVLETVEKDEK